MKSNAILMHKVWDYSHHVEILFYNSYMNQSLELENISLSARIKLLLLGHKMDFFIL